jgi:N-acetylmuramoyl-L-alanine amidase
MKRIFAIGLLLVLSFTLLTFGLVSVRAENPLEEKIIALDAGHGADDIGAWNKDYQIAEKDVNLVLAYALKDKLEANGATVILTRKDDSEDPSNRERCKRAKGANVLISIHHNGSSDSTVDGTETYYTQPSDKPLAQTEYNELIKVFGPERGVKRAAYGMTVLCKMPSTLTEAYFITNNIRAAQYLAYNDLNNPNDHIVDWETSALYQGLVNYFSTH